MAHNISKYKMLLTDLPPDSLQEIARMLSMKDHFSLCISLCSLNLQEILYAVRQGFKDRVNRLSKLWRCIYYESIVYMTDLDKGNYTPRDYFGSKAVQRQFTGLLGFFGEAAVSNYLDIVLEGCLRSVLRDEKEMGFPPPPTVLTEGVKELFLVFLDDTLCKTIAAELPNIRELTLSQRRDIPKFRVLLALPNSLSYLTQLTILNIDIPGLNEFPRCVLKLCNLTTLRISDAHIRVLPEEIGTRLSKLQTLGIPGNPIKRLPDSLLSRIEDYLNGLHVDYANIGEETKPIYVRGTNITDEYLRSILTRSSYPNLRRIYFPEN